MDRGSRDADSVECRAREGVEVAPRLLRVIMLVGIWREGLRGWLGVLVWRTLIQRFVIDPAPALGLPRLLPDDARAVGLCG